MIQTTAQTRVFVSNRAIDFRCGIDSLGGIIKNIFKKDPMDGTLFVFTNKRRDGIKILAYDFQGYWLCHKRYSSGKLKWWPTGEEGEEISALDHRNLLLLIYNGDAKAVQFQANWRDPI